jgi:serine/threonine protein kinase
MAISRDAVLRNRDKILAEYPNKSRLGEGAFAEVWCCERVADGALLAKKVLRADARPKMVERFRQEVRICAKLDHPNIVKVIDSQLASTPYWYVMPMYRASLRDELTRVIGNAARTQKIFGAVLDGVEYAHKEGVIHRDIKPHNVMMNGDDDVVVTDFGIGRILDAEGDRFTATGQGMGTRSYASPEQTSDGKHVDHRSDIYSLGRMLYELYTERLNSAIQDLARLPPNIAPIVERCTQYHPNDRFQSIAELKDGWRAANEITSPNSGVGEAKRLVTELAATPTLQAKAKRLLQLLMENDDNRDLLRDALMQIPPVSVALMLDVDRDLLRTLVRQFVDHVTSQNWGASYLDKLGVRCGNLYVAIKDAPIRADLIYCNLIIGVTGKRYAVLEALAQLLQSAREAFEVKAIQDRLWSVSKEIRLEAGGWLELDEVDPKVAVLFRA